MRTSDLLTGKVPYTMITVLKQKELGIAFMKRPHILVTNDDGISAKGIRHLWEALRGIADVTVVAPAGEQSAVGLSTTIRNPLRIEEVLWERSDGNVWSVTGTPADCVKMAFNAIIDTKPDFVFSGINRGANAGRNVLYSGTVAAAIESVMQHVPAIAFSCQDYRIEPNYAYAAKYVPIILEYIQSHPLPPETLLNINFPGKIHDKYKGFKMTTQGRQWWAENPDKRIHPGEGNAYYWLGSKLHLDHPEADSDGAWLDKGYVTAVPIHIGNLTHQHHLDEKRTHFEQAFTGPL